MKLLEKLKAVPKKTLVLSGLLVVMAVLTVILSVIVATQPSAPQDQYDNTQQDSIPVFNNSQSNTNNKNPGGSGTSNTQNDTTTRLDMSDVYGLDYVSNGDGTCYIKGIGTCTKTELEIPSESPHGDKVVKIHDRAFENCKELVSITIPSSVKTIGSGAFRGCEKLVAINVNAQNGVYCSVGGVLFSKDRSVLVCYPMNRQGSSYLLSTDVKAIGSFAFEGVINLNKLLYRGNIASFQQIDILMGNDVLEDMAITCNYVGAK
jgi:hypothetical protein